MLVYSDILTVLCQYFPDDTLATGRSASMEIIDMINSENAADAAPTINVVNDVNTVKIANEDSIRLVSDLIARQFRERKITAIKELRGAFPHMNLKQSKDSIEDSFRRCGFDNSGRIPDTFAEEPLAPWEQELLAGRNTDPINRPTLHDDDESDRF